MKTLVLDTATAATLTGLGNSSSPQSALELRDDPRLGSRPRHSELLLVQAAALLDQAGWRWAELEAVAVGVGPGTFTGLRIGVATARALADSLKIPLIGVSTLESLAVRAAQDTAGSGSLLAAVDARRHELFAAAWDRDGPNLRACLTAPAPFSESALTELMATLAPPVLAVGPGAALWAAPLAAAGATVPDGDSELYRVSAAGHLRLAAGQSGGRPQSVLPEYLRLPDAELVRRRRAAEEYAR